MDYLSTYHAAFAHVPHLAVDADGRFWTDVGPAWPTAKGVRSGTVYTVKYKCKRKLFLQCICLILNFRFMFIQTKIKRQFILLFIANIGIEYFSKDRILVR